MLKPYIEWKREVRNRRGELTVVLGTSDVEGCCELCVATASGELTPPHVLDIEQLELLQLAVRATIVDLRRELGDQAAERGGS